VKTRLELFERVRLYSSMAVAMVIVASLVASQLIGSKNLTWQVAIALCALAVGIPHGALDHFVTVPRTNKKTMVSFIFIYVLVACAAALAILKWNVLGFQIVVLMSLVHFGIGDSAFLNELDRLKEKSSSRLPTAFVVLAFGSIPVVLPLVNSSSTSALSEVNVNLVNWHQGFEQDLRLIVLFLFIVALAALLITKRFRDMVDLFLLAALAVLTPPLIAFAVYFGCWHAMRHTARLTLVLPKSQSEYDQSHALKAFWSAVIPGTPALIGSFVVAAGLWIYGNVDKSFFWFVLTIVWALTIPHMIVTAKLDRKALRI
jgi:beta-carotene 15,15'-dioxygenase